MAGETIDGDRGRRDPLRSRGRRLLIVAGVVVVAVALLRFALGLYAADLFRSLLERGAARSGLAIRIEGAPEVSVSGFRAAKMTVTRVGGGEILKAGQVGGDTDFSIRPPYVTLSLKLSDVESALLSGSGETELPAPVLPPNLTSVSFERTRLDLGSGRTIDFDGELSGGSAGLRLRVSRAGYSDASEQFAAEKLAFEATLAEASGEAQSPRALHFDLNVAAGALLAGPVLLDFAAHPLAASGNVVRTKDGVRRISTATLTLGRLLRLQGGLSLDKNLALAAADLEAASEQLGPAFQTLVLDPFGATLPALDGASIEGSAKLSLQMESASRHAASGRLNLTGKSLRTRSLAASDLDLDLPWIGASLRPRPDAKGHLRASRVELFSLPWGGVASALAATPGRLRAVDAQQWKTLGGVLRLSDLVYEDDAEAGPRLSARVRVEDLVLRQVADAIGAGKLEGTLHGDLGTVRLDAESLRADGTLDARLYGGSVLLSRLGIDQPFSRVPALRMDLVASEIDLTELSAAFGFGHVSGVLEGHVTGLVLADGQPQAFDADLHSVERRGVSQTVDVRAISQLGVLSGGDTGSLTGTFLKVFDRYRYSELGMKARLRNDVFELRGVRSEEGKDYIVKGSRLPPSVSVVSHSQVLSFSEMLRRVQRVADIGEGETPNAAKP